MKNLLIIHMLFLTFLSKINSQTADIDIYKNNFRELLCFEHESNEKSGITKVGVILSPNIQAKISTFKWVAKKPGINLVNKTKTSVMIQAVAPGPNTVVYEAYDKSSKSLGKVEIPISVPQFVNIYEYTGDEYKLLMEAIPKGVDKSKAKEFEEVLKYAGLNSYRNEIYKEARKVTETLLKDANIRLLWNDIGEKLPEFVDKSKTFRLRFGGFARDYDTSKIKDSLNYQRGLTYTETLSSFVATGRLTDMSTDFAKSEIGFGNHSYEKIMLFLKDKSVSESRKKTVFILWKKIFTRAFGFVMAHEIGHNLLQLPDKHTNVAKHGDDMMSDKFDDLDIGLIITNQSFPEGKSYKWINLKGFNSNNLGKIHAKYPIASNPIFKKFTE